MLAIAGHLARRSGRGRHEAADVRVPIGCPNPRGFPGKAGESYSSPAGRNSAVSSDFAYGLGPHVLLAMQKVEGSNPFSRLPETSTTGFFAGILIRIPTTDLLPIR